MAQKKKDRWVSVEVKNASGRKVKKWKDTTTGKTYFSRPLRDPTKTSATGQFGVNKLTNDPKLNKSIKAAQEEGWEASRQSNRKSASEGFTGGVLGGNIPGSKRSKISSKSTKTEKSSKKSNLKIKGTPGSSRGAMAAKAMAKARKDAGKSTLGDFGSGEDRGMKAAQAAAKARIADKKKNPNKYKKKKSKFSSSWD